MSHEPVTSMTMIEKAKLGDNDAWVRLTTIYGPLVHQQCVRKGVQWEDAKDITMIVFQNVHRSLGTFSKDRESDRFLKFLRTIVTCRIADHLRKEGRRRDKAVGGDLDWITMVPDVKTPLNTAEEESVMEQLWSVEDLMTDLEAQIWNTAKRKYGGKKTFQAFEMRELKGMEVSAIADLLGITESAVTTYANRVKTWIEKQVRMLPNDVDEVPDDASTD